MPDNKTAIADPTDKEAIGRIVVAMSQQVCNQLGVYYNEAIIPIIEGGLETAYAIGKERGK